MLSHEMGNHHVVLIFQGGGAHGTYQAGVYQGLEEQGLTPDWIVGTAIGALNGAIVAGNSLERRLAQLRSFWQTISQTGYWGMGHMPEDIRQVYGFWNAMGAMLTRRRQPWSYENSKPSGKTQIAVIKRNHPGNSLSDKLQQLINFKLLNQGSVRLTLGAMHVSACKLGFFDNVRQSIRPEHVMASGALPPGFPVLHVKSAMHGDNYIHCHSSIFQSSERSHRAILFVIVDLSGSSGQKSQLYTKAEAHCHNDFIKHSLLHLFNEKTGIKVILLNYPDHEWQSGIQHSDFSWTTLQKHWYRGYSAVQRALEYDATSMKRSQAGP